MKKKKILIVGALVLTLITCFLVVPSKSVSAEENTSDYENGYNAGQCELLDELYEMYYNGCGLSSDPNYFTPSEFKNLMYVSKYAQLMAVINYYKSLGYDEGFDEGHDDGYTEGYETGFDNCLNDTLNELSYLKFGPLASSNARFEYCFHQDYSNRKSYSFKQNAPFLTNTYFDFNYFVKDLYFTKYGTYAIPDDAEGSVEVSIVFETAVKASDLQFKISNSIFFFEIVDYGGYNSYFYGLDSGTIMSQYYDGNYYYFEGSNFFDEDVYIEMITFTTRGIVDIDNTTLSFASASFGDFDEGYGAGYTNGYDKGKEDGISVGKDLGYDEGYGAGYAENNFTLQNLFWTIAGLPFETMSTIWNVEFLGINLAGFLSGLLMFGVILFVIKKVVL